MRLLADMLYSLFTTVAGKRLKMKNAVKISEICALTKFARCFNIADKNDKSRLKRLFPQFNRFDVRSSSFIGSDSARMSSNVDRG